MTGLFKLEEIECSYLRFVEDVKYFFYELRKTEITQYDKLTTRYLLLDHEDNYADWSNVLFTKAFL